MGIRQAGGGEIRSRERCQRLRQIGRQDVAGWPNAPRGLYFTRVGYWTESIASNAKSAEVAKDSKEFHDQLHAMDYLVYAHLQLSQDGKAKAVLEQMKAVTGIPRRSSSGRSPWRHPLPAMP